MGYSGALHNCSSHRRGNCSGDRRGNATGADGSWSARCRPSVGKHNVEGVSLPWRPSVREDESRRVYV